MLITQNFDLFLSRYSSAVEDVLVSVQKTEESLRRLKNLRDRSTTGAPATDRPQGMSDDDKIRLQLQIDVIFWSTTIGKMGINNSDIDKLTELLCLVEDATKIKIEEKL